jgi:hypothetical protein
MAILKLTAREDFSTADLVRTVQSDGALTGRLLKMANSARAAGVQPITSVAEATMRLGAMAVRNVALGFSLMSSHRTGLCAAFDYDNYWSVSLARGVIAQNLARLIRGVAPAESFVCGLLGRIGALALATTHAPNCFAGARAHRGRACLKKSRKSSSSIRTRSLRPCCSIGDCPPATETPSHPRTGNGPFPSLPTDFAGRFGLRLESRTPAWGPAPAMPAPRISEGSRRIWAWTG